MFITKLTSFFLAIAVALSSVGLLFERRVPEAPSRESLLSMPGVFETKQPESKACVVNAWRFSDDEKRTVVALQGLVNRDRPRLFLMYSGADSDYLSEIAAQGIEPVRENNGDFTLESLIEFFKPYITDCGYTLYKKDELAFGLNAAVNYATAYGWLPVCEELESAAASAGLTKKKDLSKETYDYKFQEKVFNELKDFFRTGAVMHVEYRMPGLRDLAIQQKLYCFYTESDRAGEKYLKKILKWSGRNTAVEGWCEDEKRFVDFISGLGCFINPTDLCVGNSYLAHVRTDGCSFSSAKGQAHSDPSKHYVTLVYSDGDNCQWIQNGFSEYRTFTNYYSGIKMTWTFSPFFQDFCPLAVKRTVLKDDGNQSFIAGPSGYGYCNPLDYDAKALDGYTAMTASSMLRCGQRIVTVLDDYSVWKDAKFGRRLGYFSRFDNIDGGILFLDPDGYRAGKGKVWFADGKPFVSARMSLWANNGYEGATDEWIKERADVINGYPVDITSINGYSVICVQAWTMHPESVQKFVNSLDSHVEILSAEDFIETVRTNIPHKNAAPEQCFR